LEVGDGDLVLDLAATLAADPAVVWAHLTSPSLRMLWEGPISIQETSPSGRRGVGTMAQCVTGRLATLEEIVDWQPYDHVGWRLAVPGLGPVAATADFEPEDAGTRLRIRWQQQGDEPADPSLIEAIRAERKAAFLRLGTTVAGALPVVESREATS
jgi:hypothetical protein